MLQPLFHIESGDLQAENLQAFRLMVVLDENSLSYVILDSERASPVCIKHYHLRAGGERELQEVVREIIFADDGLSREISDVFIVYGFAESLLMPEIFFDEAFAEGSMSLVHGKAEKGHLQNEKVPWWNICNVYRVPPAMSKLLRYKFPTATYIHYYSLLLKSFKRFISQELDERMHIIFFEARMIVSAYKKSQLELMQSYPYTNQMDVAYQLLNCCGQLGFNQQHLLVQLSGFIEKKSAVYHEIAKYFPHLLFEEPGEHIQITEELKQYPPHYFSSLLKIATCA